MTRDEEWLFWVQTNMTHALPRDTHVCLEQFRDKYLHFLCFTTWQVSIFQKFLHVCIVTENKWFPVKGIWSGPNTHLRSQNKIRFLGYVNHVFFFFFRPSEILQRNQSVRETLSLDWALVLTKRPHSLNSVVTKIFVHYRVKSEESDQIIPRFSAGSWIRYTHIVTSAKPSGKDLMITDRSYW